MYAARFYSTPLTHTTLTRLPRPTICTRDAPTPTEDHTSTTTSTRNPPTWPRPLYPPNTNTIPTSTRTEGASRVEGLPPPAPKRRRGTSSTRR